MTNNILCFFSPRVSPFVCVKHTTSSQLDIILFLISLSSFVNISFSLDSIHVDICFSCFISISSVFSLISFCIHSLFLLCLSPASLLKTRLITFLSAPNSSHSTMPSVLFLSSHGWPVTLCSYSIRSISSSKSFLHSHSEVDRQVIWRCLPFSCKMMTSLP